MATSYAPGDKVDYFLKYGNLYGDQQSNLVSDVLALCGEAK